MTFLATMPTCRPTRSFPTTGSPRSARIVDERDESRSRTRRRAQHEPRGDRDAVRRGPAAPHRAPTRPRDWGAGHAEIADLTLTTDYVTAREIFLAGNPQAAHAGVHGRQGEGPGRPHQADGGAGGRDGPRVHPGSPTRSPRSRSDRTPAGSSSTIGSTVEDPTNSIGAGSSAIDGPGRPTPRPYPLQAETAPVVSSLRGGVDASPFPPFSREGPPPLPVAATDGAIALVSRSRRKDQNVNVTFVPLPTIEPAAGFVARTVRPGR